MKGFCDLEAKAGVEIRGDEKPAPEPASVALSEKFSATSCPVLSKFFRAFSRGRQCQVSSVEMPGPRAVPVTGAFGSQPVDKRRRWKAVMSMISALGSVLFYLLCLFFSLQLSNLLNFLLKKI